MSLSLQPRSDFVIAEARRIMSEEHKALGYRPPHGSLASAAQAAASKHPNPESNALHIDEEVLRKAALEDAARISAQRSQPGSPEMNSSTSGINLDAIGTGMSKFDCKTIRSQLK